MRIQNKKQAYTLAEIMLVILVLTIIFAAMAPIFTKRKITSYTGKYNVWESAGVNTTGDAYTDPEDPALSGELFFGVTPGNGSAVQTQFAPLSKMVIRAGRVTSDDQRQHHIQFRYGRTSATDAGEFAGSWYFNRRNMLLGGSYYDLEDNEQTGARDNVAVGFRALDKLKNGSGNVAVGYQALKSTTTGKNNVAVGYQAGLSNNSSENIFIGHNAGQGYKGKGGVYIGYNAGRASTETEGTNLKNLAIGAYAGGGLDGNSLSFKSSTIKDNEKEHPNIPQSGGGKENTAIGYKALANVTTGESNIAIGYQALANLTTGSNNVAIGYNACINITNESNKTCIGYNSGPRKKSQGNMGSAYLLWGKKGGGDAGLGKGKPRGDSVERTYIGGPPKNYGGDAVLEIHNLTSFDHLLSEHTDSKIPGNTTTIVNGNLIVRGRPYFTVGNALYHFHNDNINTKDPNSAYIRYYGYKNPTEDKFADCQGDGISYTQLNTKCPNFNTTTSSDRRLKNISDRYTAGLNELKQIKVYNFTFKNDEKKVPQVGVIAQELREVFPTAVVTDEKGYLKIRWEEMFYAVVNAVKELDKKIVALVKRTTKVESQISKLEQENTTLKAQVDNLRERVNKLKAQ